MSCSRVDVFAENHLYGKFTRAEAVTHGLGRLYEDGIMSIHCQLLWRPLQGGELTNIANLTFELSPVVITTEISKTL